MFSDQITAWYKINKRNLPWRDTTDPYKIWLSEIILQQTRVDQGMNYYLKFIEHYPTVNDLAAASEQEVLNDWQGLGYYSRARNLHATAKFIAQECGGKFPATYDEIIRLKGVGPYTAAAIASFAFKEVKALVDGNVYRILSRYFDISTPIDSTSGKKEFQLLADSLIPADQPDLHNQAIMEFGSQQCTPVNPDCTACMLNDSCQALINQTVSARPVKEKKTKVRNRYFYYAVFMEKNQICVQKRTQADIWQHLFEFPLLEAASPLTEQELTAHYLETCQLTPEYISGEVKHILSHQRIITRFIHFSHIPEELHPLAIELTALEKIPLPRLIHRYIEDAGL
ncbi:MAG: A/G-specific adenine glycosylase [Crocinitomicaceae bacterium]|nr:A/G-specific adenine glycosylase [Crocinitomicaceae bacterium]